MNHLNLLQLANDHNRELIAHAEAHRLAKQVTADRAPSPGGQRWRQLAGRDTADVATSDAPSAATPAQRVTPTAPRASQPEVRPAQHDATDGEHDTELVSAGCR